MRLAMWPTALRSLAGADRNRRDHRQPRHDGCPKLNAKLVKRLFHGCWQVPPPVNSVAHCFFGGCYHLTDGNIAVGLRHCLASLLLGLPRGSTSIAAGPCANAVMRAADSRSSAARF